MTRSSGGLRRRDALKLLAGAPALGCFGGWRSPAFAAQPAGSAVLKVAMAVNPSSLDPATGRSGYDHMVLYTMFDTLIAWNYDDLTPKPGLASRWTQPDPKTLVLDLVDGVTFHDGTPCDAEAVRFNLERGRTDQRYNVKADLASIDTVKVTGPLQITLALKQPDAALVLTLSDRAGMMASPKALREMGADFDRNPVGTGPYRFVSFSNNDKVLVRRYDGYWRKDLEHLDGIDFSIISEVSTGLRAVISGQDDFINALSAQLRPLVQHSPNIATSSMATQFVNIVYLNYGRPPFDDLRVRQALNYAVDRDAFVQFTDLGMAEATCGLLPKQQWAYDAEAAGWYKHDPDRAKALLAAAGHGGGIDINLVGTNDQRAVQRQEVLIDQVGRAGIRLHFTQLEVPDATGQYMGPAHVGDGYLQQWTGRPDPSLTFGLVFGKDSYFNAGQADPVPEREVLQRQSVATPDLPVRKEVLGKLQRLIADNALACPLSMVVDLTAMTKTVEGYRPDLLGKPKFTGVRLTTAG